MTISYRRLVEAHITAQSGEFIDEVIDTGAGTLVFSRREDEPMWNMLFVDNLPAALAIESKVAEEFKSRGRMIQWALAPECALFRPWYLHGTSFWMARGKTDLPEPTKPEMRHFVVDSSRLAEDFNRLYLKVFWGDEDSSQAALPLSTAPADIKHLVNSNIQHWLLYEGREAVASTTTVDVGDMCGIYNVGTHPDHLRKGYATELLTRVMKIVFDRGADYCFLLTEDEGLPPFYSRIGFETISHSKFYRKDF